MMQTIGLYAATLVVGLGAMVGQRLVTGWIGLKVIWDLRDGVFRHLQSLSLRFFDTREMGDTISRMTNDIDLLNELISELGENMQIKRFERMVLGEGAEAESGEE